MAALLLVLALLVGVVVGDLVLENPTIDEASLFGHTITGYPQGWPLVAAAALGFLMALLLAASGRASRARRARRKQLRDPVAAGDSNVVKLDREDTSHRDAPPGPTQPVSDLREPNWPAELGRDPSSQPLEDRYRPGTTRPAQNHSEPLYQQSRRAAQHRDDPHRHLPPDTRPPGNRRHLAACQEVARLQADTSPLTDRQASVTPPTSPGGPLITRP
jgi:hypothetical protein